MAGRKKVLLKVIILGKAERGRCPSNPRAARSHSQVTVVLARQV